MARRATLNHRSLARHFVPVHDGKPSAWSENGCDLTRQFSLLGHAMEGIREQDVVEFMRNEPRKIAGIAKDPLACRGACARNFCPGRVEWVGIYVDTEDPSTF